MNEIKRGDLYYADLSPIFGSEQDGFRPVLVIQNNLGNTTSNTTIVAAVTSKIEKKKLPTHIRINTPKLPMQSAVLTEQLRTIDIRRLGNYIDHLDDKQMRKVDQALKISLELHTDNKKTVRKGNKHYDKKIDPLHAKKRTRSPDGHRSSKNSPDWEE